MKATANGRKWYGAEQGSEAKSMASVKSGVGSTHMGADWKFHIRKQ